MRALVLDPDGSLCLRELPTPAVPGECLIRVAAAGICGTDLELLRGYAGFAGVPGHEFVGVVEAAPPGDEAWIGRRVVGEITVGCGHCAGCLAAGRGHCDARTVLGIRGRDGAFAEYLLLPAINLHEVPASLDDPTAVFVEPLAAACRIIEQIDVPAGARAAVVGAGRLGLLVAHVLRAHGAQVVTVARGVASRARAARLGFDAMAVEDALGSFARRLELAVDTTGDPAGFRTAAALVRPRGTVVVKSTFHGETSVDFSTLVVDEITVVGSRCGPFAAALDLLASGRIDVRPLVSHLFPLSQYREAFERAREGVKVIFSPL